MNRRRTAQALLLSLALHAALALLLWKTLPPSKAPEAKRPEPLSVQIIELPRSSPPPIAAPTEPKLAKKHPKPTPAREAPTHPQTPPTVAESPNTDTASS